MTSFKISPWKMKIFIRWIKKTSTSTIKCHLFRRKFFNGKWENSFDEDENEIDELAKKTLAHF